MNLKEKSFQLLGIKLYKEFQYKSVEILKEIIEEKDFCKFVRKTLDDSLINYMAEMLGTIMTVKQLMANVAWVAEEVLKEREEK